MIPKFRVWNKKTESFIDYGDLMLDLKNAKVYAGDVGIPEYTIDITKQVILMQSTGIKDKNGVEIFEGDIVSYFKKGLSVIKWKNGGYLIENYEAGLRDSLQNRIAEIEVLGNIYENPELLEAEK